MFEHPGAGPFVIGPPSAPRVVLIHGLTGAPSELWPLGLALAGAGFRVEAPLLPGHGRTPSELARVSAGDLLEVARAIGREAAGDGALCIGGLSMGALLALVAAAEYRTLSRLVLLAPATRMIGASRVFDTLGRVPWPSGVRMLVAKGRAQSADGTFSEPDARGPLAEAARAAERAEARPRADGRYERIPIRWSRELRCVRDAARTAAAGVRASALILHGLLDRTADPLGACVAAEWLARAPATVRLLPRSPHVLTLGPERGAVAADVLRFLAHGGGRAAAVAESA